VNNLLGQLMASGLLKNQQVEEENVPVPEMNLKIDELKR